MPDEPPKPPPKIKSFIAGPSQAKYKVNWADMAKLPTVGDELAAALAKAAVDNILKSLAVPTGLLSGACGGTTYANASTASGVTMRGLMATMRYLEGRRRSDALAAEMPRWLRLAVMAERFPATSRWVDLRGRVGRDRESWIVPCDGCRKPDDRLATVRLDRLDLPVDGWLWLSIHLGACDRCGLGYWA